MARSNRAARRRARRVHPDQRQPDARLALKPVPILQGLPGGEVYVSERELEQFAMTVFEAVAAMHPGMEARKQAASDWGLEVTAPRAEVESELIEIHAALDPEKGLQYVPDKRRRSATAYLEGFHA